MFSFACAILFALLLGVGAARTAAAAPAAQSGQPVAVAKYENVYVRSGPSEYYPSVGVLTLGQSCPVTARDINSGWWSVQCPNGVGGWVSYDAVTVIGDISLVPLVSASSPVAIATPAVPGPSVPDSFWYATYYANKDLAGTPVLTQNIPQSEINFDWGTSSPGPTVPADAFSARYERRLALTPGTYQLTLSMDDGARVFVDDVPVLDDWRTGPKRTLSVVYALGSNPLLRVEYFEEGATASLFFAVTPTTAPMPVAPTPTPPYQPQAPDLAVIRDQWRAQYFNNTDLAGQPIAAQYEPRGYYPLDKYWGTAPPVGGIAMDYWSARFEGQFYFAPGNYNFYVQSDDGVRVYIDNILLINAWFDGMVNTSNGFDQVGDGYHTMKVEYYERSGNAYVRVYWYLSSATQTPYGPLPPPPT